MERVYVVRHLISDCGVDAGMSKYKAVKTTVDGIRFDSKAEANHYLYLKALLQKGEIAQLKLQPTFILQEAFVKDDIKHQAIKYKADFEVTYPDGTIEIIDVKGMETKEFKLKHKLFEKRYPDLQLKLVR